MGSFSKVIFKGVLMLYSDMSESKPSEIIETCMKSREVLKDFPPYSALVLVNVKGIRFNSQVIEIIKETTKINSEFVKTTAVYGLEGFTAILLNVVAKFSKREMKAVQSLKEGREWLYSQSLISREQHAE